MNKQSAWMVSLCLLAISSSNEAFTTLPSSPFTRTRSHQSLHTLYSSFELENRAETPEPSFLSTNDNVGGLDDDNNNMMMRPNKDVIINTSILILAIVIVIERILSVDTGITRGWSPTRKYCTKGRIADGCMYICTSELGFMQIRVRGHSNSHFHIIISIHIIWYT